MLRPPSSDVASVLRCCVNVECHYYIEWHHLPAMTNSRRIFQFVLSSGLFLALARKDDALPPRGKREKGNNDGRKDVSDSRPPSLPSVDDSIPPPPPTAANRGSLRYRVFRAGGRRRTPRHGLRAEPTNEDPFRSPPTGIVAYRPPSSDVASVLRCCVNIECHH